jgi:hypothetical protein
MTENQEKQKIIKIPNKNSMRNMRQYQNMSDADFDELYNKIIVGVDKDQLLQERFDRMMRQYQNEYDLSELLPNDRATLESLISAQMQLNDFETGLRLTQKEGISFNNISLIRELNEACSRLRKDISSMQDDLKITRKIRKSDKEQNVINFVEDLKKKANTFAHLKMNYIFCEKCGQLLATAWWQVPEQRGNEIKVECKRKLENETVCGWSKKFTAKELLAMGGSNRIELMPESIR